jgi:hypothetical protein
VFFYVLDKDLSTSNYKARIAAHYFNSFYNQEYITSLSLDYLTSSTHDYFNPTTPTQGYLTSRHISGSVAINAILDIRQVIEQQEENGS